MSKNKYWSTATDDVRNAFMLMRKDKNAASKAFYIWLAEVKAQAWAEGFDAGERDVFEHDRTGWDDSPCIPNPYRKENK